MKLITQWLLFRRMGNFLRIVLENLILWTQSQWLGTCQTVGSKDPGSNAAGSRLEFFLTLSSKHHPLVSALL